MDVLSRTRDGDIWIHGEGSMKASVFIPCTNSHFWHLPKVIDAYYRGSAIPEEIVVFSSGMRHVSKDDISSFQNNYPRIQLVCADELVKAGPTRQIASSLCSGDIVIYQDADDLPHYRRVQFVKHFFTVTDCYTINHAWQNYSEYPGQDIDLRSCTMEWSTLMWDKYWPTGNFMEINRYTQAFGAGYSINFHAGALAIRKFLLNEFRWKAPHELDVAAFNPAKAEDYQLLAEIWFKYPDKGLVVPAPLYFYKT